MASPQEYAELSDAVYAGPGATEAPPGWTRLMESRVDPGYEGTENGYYGVAFVNDETGEIVVANRGSRPSMAGLQEDWLSTDAQIALQGAAGIPPAFGDAQEFAQQVGEIYPESPITFAGHSLGGGHAQVQAAGMPGTEAVTFAAPGVAFAVEEDARQLAADRITNYVLPGDPVTRSGQHVGEVISLHTPGSTLKTAASLALGMVVGGPLGILASVAALAAFHHPLGSYQAALGGGTGAASAPSAPGAGRPAARMGDMHVCPLVTATVPHVGGPIAGPSAPTVLVSGLPAAVLGDLVTCAGPPDALVLSSVTVLVTGRPLVRMGDTTAHGGSVVAGAFTVLVGA